MEPLRVSPSYLPVTDPQTPFFEIWVNDEKLAELIEPAWEEMFWCSYKLVPINPEHEPKLRDNGLWDECRFEIREHKTGVVTGIPLAGGYSFKEYCAGRTDRIDFRSLWPSQHRQLTKPKPKGLFGWVRGLFSHQ